MIMQCRFPSIINIKVWVTGWDGETVKGILHCGKSANEIYQITRLLWNVKCLKDVTCRWAANSSRQMNQVREIGSNELFLVWELFWRLFWRNILQLKTETMSTHIKNGRNHSIHNDSRSSALQLKEPITCLLDKSKSLLKLKGPTAFFIEASPVCLLLNVN